MSRAPYPAEWFEDMTPQESARKAVRLLDEIASAQDRQAEALAEISETFAAIYALVLSESVKRGRG